MPILMNVKNSQTGLSITNPEWLEVEKVTQKKSPSLGNFGPHGPGTGMRPVYTLEIERLVGSNGIMYLGSNLVKNPIKIVFDFYEPGEKTPFLSLAFDDPVPTSWGTDGKGSRTKEISYRSSSQK